VGFCVGGSDFLACISCGEIGEDVPRVLLGEKLDRMEEEKESFRVAMERHVRILDGQR